MLPSVVQWEITYACPLRCSHCYSESGSRPARQLTGARLFALTDALAAMKPRVVHVSGGEPLLVGELTEVASRLRSAGVSVVLTTSGFGLDEARARELAEVFHSIHVSVDGADKRTHDRIRGRAGSFAAAMNALALFDGVAAERRRAGTAPLRFGIDFVVLRSNFGELERVVTDLAPRFRELEWLIFNGVVPVGLASRESYEPELLTDEMRRRLGDEELAGALQAAAPEGVIVVLRDNFDLSLHPEIQSEGSAWTLDRLVVEPDGEVRALGAYEGLVGSLLDEPIEVLWARALERRNDPRVVEALAGVRTARDWAAAARRLDLEFAPPRELVRIRKRKPYVPG
jgi:MoaA/NifB/PqqE/SkfB family radical SAM enzyme